MPFLKQRYMHIRLHAMHLEITVAEYSLAVPYLRLTSGDHRLNEGSFYVAYVNKYTFLRNKIVYCVQHCLSIAFRSDLLHSVQDLLLQTARSCLHERSICQKYDMLLLRGSKQGAPRAAPGAGAAVAASTVTLPASGSFILNSLASSGKVRGVKIRLKMYTMKILTRGNRERSRARAGFGSPTAAGLTEIISTEKPVQLFGIQKRLVNGFNWFAKAKSSVGRAGDD